MARIKTSGLISNISGSVAGMTFQQANSGLILRKKPIPLKIDSPSQHHQRNSISFLQSYWRDLADEDRLKWQYFLSWSNQSQNHNTHLLINGYQLFLKYQSARLLAGLDVLLNFSFVPLEVVPKTFVLFNSGSTFYMFFDDYVSSDQYFFNLFLTMPVNIGTKYRNNGLRFIPVTYHTERQYYLIDKYQSIFGSVPSAGAQLNFRIYWFGITSPVLGFYQTGSKIIQSI
jgi:hypothetical protein